MSRRGLRPVLAAAGPDGAPGLGDPMFPPDGNGGYQVRHYALDFDRQAPRTPFEAKTRSRPPPYATVTSW